MKKRKRLVIIGNSVSSLRCIEQILIHNPNMYNISIFSDELYPLYNQINTISLNLNIKNRMLKKYNWYKQHNIKLFTSEKVIEIDREDEVIVTDKRRIVFYDKLIIATGSTAFIFPVKGLQLFGVNKLKTTEEIQFLLSTKKHSKKSIIIGNGMLGLKIAQKLLDLGIDVHVVHFISHLMANQDILDCSLLRNKLKAKGIQFFMEKNTVKILGTEYAEGIQFEDGTIIKYDLIVIPIGRRPNTHLAEKAGLHVNRGIVVNKYMQTNDKLIYAVGECTEHNGITLGFPAPLHTQATVLAEHITNIQKSTLFA
ncbi:nitrite reductase [Bacillus toyonensis]|uniref:FAD-dependent oxidoreductase n=1 Tax=Bacillus toyonensis TaxID=155322 RepID=UPI000BED722C|nr:FAD-dependent oxidoreductase [Bacillus toyonensis]PEF78364.1 nitrite reductase [Bacillus toyonensis]PFY19280.1 nitrite reductase [Bacillus toyonensis]PHB93429.1 nitrite reductase [Bacillus toyonensis]PHE23408.1 nitrite reductase [Bacillus toyonensis]